MRRRLCLAISRMSRKPAVVISPTRPSRRWTIAFAATDHPARDVVQRVHAEVVCDRFDSGRRL
jgi:hypothetical protein